MIENNLTYLFLYYKNFFFQRNKVFYNLILKRENKNIIFNNKKIQEIAFISKLHHSTIKRHLHLLYINSLFEQESKKGHIMFISNKKALKQLEINYFNYKLIHGIKKRIPFKEFKAIFEKNKVINTIKWHNYYFERLEELKKQSIFSLKALKILNKIHSKKETHSFGKIIGQRCIAKKSQVSLKKANFIIKKMLFLNEIKRDIKKEILVKNASLKNDYFNFINEKGYIYNYNNNIYINKGSIYILK